MSRATHPARSLEFLSRLHDGDLTAAEKAHFESHRSHCDECRKSAADFESTLSHYRTTGTSPAASDLSARILRKLEASNRRRPGLGVVFGIDLRWAGAFTAAIVAVILGTSLLERQRASRTVRSIPVSFATPPAERSAADALAKTETLAASAELAAREKAVSAETAKDASAALQKEPAAPPANRPPAALLADKTNLTVAVAAPAAAPPSAAAKPARAKGPGRDFGGDSALAEEKSRRARNEADLETRQAAAGSLELDAASSVRITVTALDDGGLAPAVLNGERVALTEADRGRYVLTVGADGVPLDVSPETHDARAKIASPPGVRTPSLRAVRALKELRFAPGDRARRLLARVE
ncbi:MAG TPA: hypothetical protein VIA45_05140 [Thermoanaerobaculia bacterium]|jgi:hypothetical protein